MKILLPVLAFAVGVAGFARPVHAQTLLTNPGFENGSTSPTGWGTVVGSTGATTTWVSGTAGIQVYSGTRAVAITAPAVNTYSARWNLLSSSRATVTGNQTYAINVWAMGSNLDLTGGINDQDGFNVGLVYYDSSNTQIGTWASASSSFASNNLWTNFSFTTTATPATATTAVFQLVYRRPATVTSGSNAMITWDDVSMAAVPEPSPVALLGLCALWVTFWKRFSRRRA